MRAYAAIAILAMHVLENSEYTGIASIVSTKVDLLKWLIYLFMIISGFSLCCGYYERILHQSISIVEFYKKRYKKILPFFALLVFMDCMMNLSLNSVIEGIADITLVYALLPNASISVLGVGWFLGIVFLFYMIFPFYCFWMRSKKNAWLTFAVCVFYNLSEQLYFLDSKDTEGSMLKYSCPLIANTVAWWITNASDRYVVMWLCGTAANGIYSVAYKIPSILNILQSIFTQAWTLSAVKEFDPEDKDGFFSNMYNGFNCLMVLACSFLILSDKFFARILYAKDFYNAWEYVPFLLISIVFGATAGYIGGIFSALKEAKMLAQSTTIGAVVNIILNIVLVSMVGAIGAAVSTAISYIVVWGIRLCYMRKYLQAKLYLKRDIASYILLVIQAVLLLLIPSGCIMYMIQIVLFIMLIGFYRKEVLMPLRVLKSKVKSCR